MKATKIILILIFCTTEYTLSNDTFRFYDLKNEEYAELLHLSKQKDKPILIYFTTSGCPPCFRIQKNVLPDTELVTFLNENFICIKTAYGENDDDSKLRAQYNIQGNPNFIIINHDGELIHKLPCPAVGSGYKTKEDLIKFGTEALQGKYSYAALKDKYDQGDRSFETTSKYFKCLTPVVLYLVEGQYDNPTQKVLDNYFATQTSEDLSSSDNWYIIKNYVDNAATEPFQYLLKHREIFYDKYGAEEVNSRINRVLNWYGGYGDLKRVKVARREMKKWDIPIVDDFLNKLE